MADYEFHPIADAYPLMEGQEFEDFAESVKGGLILPIVLYEDKILDGRNRYRACQLHGVSPVFEVYDGDDPQQFVDDANLHRRHLTPEARKARVAKLRDQGLSYRQIAAQINASPQTVMREVDQIEAERVAGPTVPNGTVDGHNGTGGSGVSNETPGGHNRTGGSTVPNGTVEKTVGSDGRHRPARSDAKTKKLQLVERKGAQALKDALAEKVISLSRAAEIANLPTPQQLIAVREARLASEEKGPGKRKPKDSPEQAETKAPSQDAEGHLVPEPIRPAFQALARFGEMGSLCRQLQKLLDETSKLPGGEQLLRFVQPTGSEGKTINKSEHLNALKRDLKGTRPHSVCPYCAGKATPACKGCNGTGWVTATTYKDADDKLKAKLH